jgi:hypothetical protein
MMQYLVILRFKHDALVFRPLDDYDETLQLKADEQP